MRQIARELKDRDPEAAQRIEMSQGADGFAGEGQRILRRESPGNDGTTVMAFLLPATMGLFFGATGYAVTDSLALGLGLAGLGGALGVHCARATRREGQRYDDLADHLPQLAQTTTQHLLMMGPDQQVLDHRFAERGIFQDLHETRDASGTTLERVATLEQAGSRLTLREKPGQGLLVVETAQGNVEIPGGRMQLPRGAQDSLRVESPGHLQTIDFQGKTRVNAGALMPFELPGQDWKVQHYQLPHNALMTFDDRGPNTIVTYSRPLWVGSSQSAQSLSQLSRYPDVNEVTWRASYELPLQAPGDLLPGQSRTGLIHELACARRIEMSQHSQQFPPSAVIVARENGKLEVTTAAGKREWEGRFESDDGRWKGARLVTQQESLKVSQFIAPNEFTGKHDLTVENQGQCYQISLDHEGNLTATRGDQSVEVRREGEAVVLDKALRFSPPVDLEAARATVRCW